MDLSNYIRVGRFDLPVPAPGVTGNDFALEASALTYNWDSDTLFLLGDEGTSIVQVSKTGQLIDTMLLPVGAGAIQDPEGLAYVGNGMFVLVEERLRTAVLFTYAGGTTLAAAAVQKVDLGTDVGNIGLEGIAYDPLTGGFVLVKENSPQNLFQTTLDFVAGTASNGSPTTASPVDLFDPALLGLVDLADVFALSAIPANAGTPEADDLVILSQESGLVLVVNRADGAILSQLAIQGDADNPLSVVAQGHEGVAVDRAGNLYLVNEQGGGADTPQLWVYAPASFANAAPTALALTNQLTEIAENTNTASRIKLADVAITDDGIGVNSLGVTGADAAFFEVDATGLYLKAGTAVDFEARASYAVTVTVDDPSVGATPDASATYALSVLDIANENPSQAAFISEVVPWSSGSSNSPVGEDWFELSNTGATALDLTGWRFDDDSASFGASVPLAGITSIAPGESVIFLNTTDLPTISARFIANWFGGTAPAGLQFGSYSGGGTGLGTGGDAIYVYDAAGMVQASVTFGASPSASPFASFDNSAGISGAGIGTLSAAGTAGAFSVTNTLGHVETASPGTVGKLFVSEAAPWSSGNNNSPVGVDWFEVTNTTAAAVTIAGWRFDDDSADFSLSAPLVGINSIAAGESVVFLNTTPANLASASAAFVQSWFGGNPPAGLRFGTYDGAGLGTGGDAITLFDAAGNLQTAISFGAATAPPAFATFDNAAAGEFAAVTMLSTPGTNGAFTIANALGNSETGSPGSIATIAPPSDDPPSAVALANAVTALAENTATPLRIKLADITVSDDGNGFNALSLSGPDAGFFEIDPAGLYLKAFTQLDFEARPSYQVTIEVDDPTVGATPDASLAYTLAVTDVANETGPAIAITEVAPWASGDSPVGEDWFEITNVGAAPVDITGWTFDDDSVDFSVSDPLLGVGVILPGESVVLLNTTAANLASLSALFLDTWFGTAPPAGLRFGTYDGAGLGTGGDAVVLFDASGAIRANIAFGPSPAGPFATFDNSAGADNLLVTALSTVGTKGAFVAANDTDAVGSPGTLGTDIVVIDGSTTSVTGGVGSDIFAVLSFAWPSGPSVTTVGITDFMVEDRLDFSQVGIGASQPPTFIGSGFFSGIAGQYRLLEVPNGPTLVEFDADGDAVADGRIQVSALATSLHETAPGSNILLLGRVTNGTPGDDQISGTLGDDTISGGLGRDFIFGSAGTDMLDGGGPAGDFLDFSLASGERFLPLSDTVPLNLQIGATTITDPNRDIATTYQGFEVLRILDGYSTTSDTFDASTWAPGGAARLIIRVGGYINHGLDTVIGSAFNDQIEIGFGAFVVDAGGGIDSVTVYAEPANSFPPHPIPAAPVIIGSSGGAALIAQGTGIQATITNAEFIRVASPATSSGPGVNLDASASPLPIRFQDSSGDDTVIGSDFDDVFLAAPLFSRITGRDSFTGGGGADIYSFDTSAAAIEATTITDFAPEDVLSLNNNRSGAFNSAPVETFIGQAAFSGLAGEYRYTWQAGQTLLQFDFDGDAAADATLTIANGEFPLETFTGSSGPHSVRIFVPSANASPQAGSDFAFTTAPAAVTIAVLANDADPDGDPFTLTDGGAPANGTVLVNPDGTLTYTPNPGFIGTDSFAYTIADAAGAAGSGAVTVQVAAPGGGEQRAGDDGDNSIAAGAGDDFLDGGAGSDFLAGLDGRDIILGSAGNDYLAGGAGDDIIVGGPGGDVLYGGFGANRYVFGEGDLTASIDTTDQITGFGLFGADVLDFSAIDAVAGGADDAFTFIGTAPFSGTAGELRYQASGTYTDVFGDTDGDGAADLALRIYGQITLDPSLIVG